MTCPHGATNRYAERLSGSGLFRKPGDQRWLRRETTTKARLFGHYPYRPQIESWNGGAGVGVLQLKVAEVISDFHRHLGMQRNLQQSPAAGGNLRVS
jgi:hypothetical protein